MPGCRSTAKNAGKATFCYKSMIDFKKQINNITANLEYVLYKDKLCQLQQPKLEKLKFVLKLFLKLKDRTNQKTEHLNFHRNYYVAISIPREVLLKRTVLEVEDFRNCS